MKFGQRFDTRFGDLQVDIENLIDHIFGDRSSMSGKTAGESATTFRCFQPRATVTESDSRYLLTMELPGVEPADVSVEVKDSNLTIAGEKKKGELKEGFSVVRDERQEGEFSRTFEFSTMVDSEKISAEFKNGLLTVALPKSEKVLPRKIEVKVTE